MKLFKLLSIFILTVTLVELLIRLFVLLYTKQVSSYYLDNKDSQSLRILAVGESTTFGLWMEQKSYPLQLQKMIDKYLGCSCVSVNIYSTPGGNTSSLLQNYATKLLSYKPDFVLFMLGVNDNHYYSYNFDLLFLEHLYKNDNKYYKIYLNSAKLLNNLSSYRIIKWLYSNFFLPPFKYSDSEERIHYPAKGSMSRQKFYSADSLLVNENTRENIQKMIDITKLNRVIPVILTYHSVEDVNVLLRKIAQENNVLLIDNEAVFNSLNSYQDYILSRDNWHPNEKGYELIAENVLNSLIHNKLIGISK